MNSPAVMLATIVIRAVFLVAVMVAGYMLIEPALHVLVKWLRTGNRKSL